MKKQFLFVVAITALTTLFSCKKADSPTPTTIPAEGNWVGKYGSGNGALNYYYAFQFNAGGTMSVKANDAVLPNTASGTWTISGDTIRSTYTYTNAGGTFSMIGKYDGHTNIISGTWGSDNDNTNGGTFTITRQ